jgi:HAD superfamily hydrolase (TIGR01509 family)
VAVEAFVFDVGETLVDETKMWQRAAEVAGVPPFTLMGVIGGLAATGRHHDEAWPLLGVDHPAATWEPSDFYPDALPCLERLQQRGYRVGAMGNTPRETEEMLRPYVQFVASATGWGVFKPAPEFFARVADEIGLAPEKIAYVGDRVDNDVGPAIEAGMVGVHIRRGPWGHFHVPPAAALQIHSLDELPEVIL